MAPFPVVASTAMVPTASTGLAVGKGGVNTACTLCVNYSLVSAGHMSVQPLIFFVQAPSQSTHPIHRRARQTCTGVTGMQADRRTRTGKSLEAGKHSRHSKPGKDEK
jgi:hypothetical protein